MKASIIKNRDDGIGKHVGCGNLLGMREFSILSLISSSLSIALHKKVDSQ